MRSETLKVAFGLAVWRWKDMARQEQSAMEKTGAGIKQTQLGWALQHSGAFLQKEAFRNEKKPEMNESQQSSPTA